MAIEECGLRGGRSSTCVVVAARASLRRPKQQMYPQSGLNTNEQTGAEPKAHQRAHLLNGSTCSGGPVQSRSWNQTACRDGDESAVFQGTARNVIVFNQMMNQHFFCSD